MYLKSSKWPPRSLNPGEVLIRVRAAGVNFFETLIRRNRFAVIPKLPTIPGVEVAGVVDALGERVDPNLLAVWIPHLTTVRPIGSTR